MDCIRKTDYFHNHKIYSWIWIIVFTVVCLCGNSYAEDKVDPQHNFVWYRVSKGDTVGHILFRYKLFPLWGANGTVQKTVDLNRTLISEDANFIEPAYWLRIPITSGWKEKDKYLALGEIKLATADEIMLLGQDISYFRYLVSMGETIFEIYKRFGFLPNPGLSLYVERAYTLNKKTMKRGGGFKVYNEWVKIPIPDKIAKNCMRIGYQTLKQDCPNDDLKNVIIIRKVSSSVNREPALAFSDPETKKKFLADISRRRKRNAKNLQELIDRTPASKIVYSMKDFSNQPTSNYGDLEVGLGFVSITGTGATTDGISAATIGESVGINTELSWKRYIGEKWDMGLSYSFQKRTIRDPADRNISSIDGSFHNLQIMGQYNKSNELKYRLFLGAGENYLLEDISNSLITIEKGFQTELGASIQGEVIFFGPIGIVAEGGGRVLISGSSENVTIKSGQILFLNFKQSILFSKNHVLGFDLGYEYHFLYTSTASQTLQGFGGNLFWTWRP